MSVSILQRSFFAIVLVIFVTSLSCSRKNDANEKVGNVNSPPKRERSVLLAPAEMKKLIGVGSRALPSDVSDIWIPSDIEILKMEAKLSEVERLRDPGRSQVNGGRIYNVDSYFMQYAGIIANGRKLIYISAFQGFQGAADTWRTRDVDINDGGASVWHAVYDPGTGEFSDLRLNGEG